MKKLKVRAQRTVYEEFWVVLEDGEKPTMQRLAAVINSGSCISLPLLDFKTNWVPTVVEEVDDGPLAV